MQTYRFTVKNKMDSGNGRLFSKVRKKGFNEVDSIICSDIYFVKCKELKEKDISLLKDVLFADTVFQYCEIEKPRVNENEHLVEVLVKKEVSDSTVTETVRICKTLGIIIEEFDTGRSYIVKGNIKRERLEFLAKTLLCNPINEYYSLSYIEPISSSFKGDTKVFYFDVAKMNDDELMNLSNTRKLSLNLEEMKAIRSYFATEERECTDVEIETIAQSWSEHCVHKTFKANIMVDKNSKEVSKYPEKVKGVLKSYIKKATDELAKPWVISSFVDNAGIIELDDEYEVSFKVETHNHPSSLEPFGGANTGVGGVIRDIMGVSARPIATTDILCFAPKDVRDLPEGTITPEDMMEGVVEGVRDYGNKMGIPTVNGNIHFHPLYATNPLVYCGCIGICPRGKHKRNQQVGDHIISLGKRTGRDGIGGATFSSMLMGEKLENPPVQQGEPIIERKVGEVIVKARDEGLYSAITDCGAGGYSSSVGEMASELGAKIELSNIKTKYEGLAPYEIWISETQERMVIAVPPKNIKRLFDICEEYDVEISDLGMFTGNKRLEVDYEGKPVINLACEFLHSGVPTLELKASFLKKNEEVKEYHEPSEQEALDAMCPNGISIKESVVRSYDYEVQGGTILKPYMGRSGHVPQDAAVLKPMEVKSKYCIALSNSLHEREAMIDPYKAAFLSIDEAVRKLIAVGVEPSRIALLDNFCLGNSKDEKVLGDLLELSRACYDASKLFETPFISGKDSFNNEYKTKDSSFIAIPPSLLISAIGRIEDEKMVVSNGFKKEGSILYLVGKPNLAFGGSLFEKTFGTPPFNANVPEVPKEAYKIYQMFYECVKKGLILSSHSVGRGGIMRTLHEMKDENLSYRFVANLEDLLGISSRFLSYYGETASCFVVEVDSERKESFENAVEAEYRLLIAKVVFNKNN